MKSNTELKEENRRLREELDREKEHANNLMIENQENEQAPYAICYKNSINFSNLLPSATRVFRITNLFENGSNSFLIHRENDFFCKRWNAFRYYRQNFW